MQNKFKIIETPDYILAVSNEEIKEGDVVLAKDTNIVFKCNEHEACVPIKQFRDIYSKAIAYQPKNNAPELDLPLLPKIVAENHILEDRIYCVDVQNYEFDTAPQTWDDEKFMSEAKIQGNVYSVEGFVKAFNKTEINQDNLIIRFIKTKMIDISDVKVLAQLNGLNYAHSYNHEIFIEGYKAATKVYSEENLKKIREILVQGALTDMSCSSAVVEFDKIIQSLKQPKTTPKWFVAETEQKNLGEVYNGHSSNTMWSDIKLKTITNLQGQTVLVGTYLYE